MNKIHIIENDELRVKVSSRGGELQSVQCREGTEFLWQGDPLYWASHAPLLFPFIGRLTNGSYWMDGKTLPMDTHGFFRFCELELLSSSQTHLSFGLLPGAFFDIYPRTYTIALTYFLSGAEISIRFHIENMDEKSIFFGYGGHPGFNVPMKQGLNFSDYRLRFSGPCKPKQVEMSDDCYVLGHAEPIELIDGQILPLCHSLFNKDAIIMTEMANAITLESGHDHHSVTLHYPDMKFLGIWHKPKTDAPFICIEPWTSIPSRKDVIETFETKTDLVALKPGQTYSNNWSITINGLRDDWKN